MESILFLISMLFWFVSVIKIPLCTQSGNPKTIYHVSLLPSRTVSLYRAKVRISANPVYGFIAIFNHHFVLFVHDLLRCKENMKSRRRKILPCGKIKNALPDTSIAPLQFFFKPGAVVKSSLPVRVPVSSTAILHVPPIFLLNS